MTRFQLSPEATQDITDIYEYIAQDSVDAAERLRVELYEAILGLVTLPGKGHRRQDLTRKSLLFWPVHTYQIIYRQHSNPLQVIAVLHGKRNIKRVLRNR